MKAPTSKEARNAFILKRGEQGTPVAEICRKAGIRPSTNQRATDQRWKIEASLQYWPNGDAEGMASCGKRDAATEELEGSANAQRDGSPGNPARTTVTDQTLGWQLLLNHPARKPSGQKL